MHSFKTYILTLLILAIASLTSMYAQKTGDYEAQMLYNSAEELYDRGRFDEAMERLMKLKDSDNSMFRTGAFRLMSLCCLENGDINSATSYVVQLLGSDPYYTPSMNDPQRFIDLINIHKKTGQGTITTASQQAETIEESPVPVTLITEDMLRDIGARTVKDALLAYVPGMTDIASNEETNIAMRGVYSSYQEKILFLVNGHRMNSYSTNVASPDFSISLEKVKQIEVLRGPASSIYGGVALTGVVNIIMKEGSDVDGTMFKATVGNHGQVRGDFLFGKRYIGLDIMAWGSVYNCTGEKYHLDGTTEAQPYSMFPHEGNMLIGAYNKKPSHDFGVNIRLNDFYVLFNRRYSNSVSPLTLSIGFTPYSYNDYMKWNGNAPGNAVTTQHIEFGYGHKFNRLSLKAIAYYDKQTQQRYQIVGDTVRDLGPLTMIFPYYSDTPIRMERGAFQCVGWDEFTFGGKLTASMSYKAGEQQIGYIMAGAEVNRFELYDAYYFEGINYREPIKVFNDEKMLVAGTENSMDIFLQVKHQFGKLFTANAGVRYDYKKRRLGKVINEISPRLALIYNNPFFNLKLSYSHSFVDAPYFYRSNTLDVEYGSEYLQPEKQNSLQLSIYSDNKIAQGLTLDVNLFSTRTTDAIIFYSSSSLAANDAKMTNIGAEFMARYHFNRMTSEVNMTYQYITNGNFSVVDHTVFNIPHFNTNVILSYNLLPNLNIHANGRFTSGQKCNFIDIFNEDPTYNGTILNIPSRFILGLGVRYNHKKFDINANVHNLLNTRYTQGGGTIAPLMQAGAWFNVSCGYTL